ncbi:MAG: hypothetical protein KF833_22700 [Verrucomicrobiae bacterium]|nr:hypothetical protein [Verrucomicrobiae bacterium]
MNLLPLPQGGALRGHHGQPTATRPNSGCGASKSADLLLIGLTVSLLSLTGSSKASENAALLYYNAVLAGPAREGRVDATVRDDIRAGRNSRAVDTYIQRQEPIWNLLFRATDLPDCTWNIWPADSLASDWPARAVVLSGYTELVSRLCNLARWHANHLRAEASGEAFDRALAMLPHRPMYSMIGFDATGGQLERISMEHVQATFQLLSSTGQHQLVEVLKQRQPWLVRYDADYYSRLADHLRQLATADAATGPGWAIHVTNTLWRALEWIPPSVSNADPVTAHSQLAEDVGQLAQVAEKIRDALTQRRLVDALGRLSSLANHPLARPEELPVMLRAEGISAPLLQSMETSASWFVTYLGMRELLGMDPLVAIHLPSAGNGSVRTSREPDHLEAVGKFDDMRAPVIVRIPWRQPFNE